MLAHLSQFLSGFLSELLSEQQLAPRWVIAYSGGLDSHVLLKLAHQYWSDLPLPRPQLVAVHIHHGLHREADGWQRHCESVCQSLSVALTAIAVDVQRESGASLEEAARKARYQAFEQFLGAGDVLLLAHHLDDQIETFMLRLLRGGGLHGLRAMPRQRSIGQGQLLRPLLALSRKQLEVYAKASGLKWIEDDSNQNQSFDRNFLRHSVLPLLASQWPAYRKSISRSIGHIADAQILLDELTRQTDVLPVETFRWGGLAIHAEALADLPALRQHNALRYTIIENHLPIPSTAQLAQILALLADGVSGLAQLNYGGLSVHRWRDLLVFAQRLPEMNAEWTAAIAPGETLTIPGVGRVSLQAVGMGQGMRIISESVTLCLRRGGLRCRPSGRAHSQSLKKLLQEYQVPAWWRDRVPLLMAGDELLAVGDLWICDGHKAGPEELGYKLLWDRSHEAQSAAAR